MQIILPDEIKIVANPDYLTISNPLNGSTLLIDARDNTTFISVKRVDALIAALQLIAGFYKR